MAKKKKAAAHGAKLRRVQIEVTVDLPAAPERVFRALTSEIGAWWTKDYTIQPERAKGLRLEPWVGGRMLEEWRGEGEGALWAVVSEIAAPERLELKGTLGMHGAMHALVELDLEAHKDGTRLELTHTAYGAIDKDAAEEYAAGWSDLLGTRLRAHVEGAADVGKKGKKKR